MQSRFRIFAGPHGSGKTHLFNYLKNQAFIHTEIYVNADEIEKKLQKKLQFNFNAYRVKVNDFDFKRHIELSGILSKINDSSFLEKIKIESGVLHLGINKKSLNSYIASFVASYLAEKLIESKQSFCLETVLSHPSKLELIKLANKANYKTYLYFIYTDNWKLNLERVRLRVKQGGHNVDELKVKERYYKSLNLFHKAASKVNSAFLIDNSRNFEVMTELENGSKKNMSKNISELALEILSNKMKREKK